MQLLLKLKAQAFVGLMCLTVSFFVVSAYAEQGPSSSVWKISSGKNSFYLGGTLHVLKESDHPLPKAYEQAYQAADTIVFEADISALEDPATQVRLGMALMAKDGQMLQQVLKPETYQKLNEYAVSRGMAMQQFAPFTASGVALMLASIELTRLGYTSEWGVEQTINNQAVKDKKGLTALETADQQIAMLSTLGQGKEDELVLYTLNDILSLPQILADIKAAWRSGDLASLEKEFIVEFKRDYPDVYDSLLLERNKDWMQQFEPMMASEATEFVLVGAMHLVGEDGLLRSLKAKGYTLEQL
ncbi:TraB/GumN family protein [Agaribacterium sp. ZY112]|uniref:TraB/GumN family protein n=1 Tax=Agaribacterium sp. ZY112 TaxID=3233574 RepID=UPI0035258424